jgi:tRNA(Ile)-lysidine synthase TilS/MesJ
LECNELDTKILNNDNIKYKNIRINYGVSLSGGVDSVSCLHYLK